MANTQTSVPVFTAGQVLTAAQQNQINTGIPVFADSTARDAAFGGTGEKTLAEGQFAYLESTNATQYYDGSTWQAVGGASGLTLISTTTIGTAVSSVTVTGAFSATYDNYKIIMVGGTISTTTALELQLGATTTGYYAGVNRVGYASGTASTAFSNNAPTFENAGIGGTNGFEANIELRNPFASKRTGFNSHYGQILTSGNSYSTAGFQDSNTSFTDFLIKTVAGTMTGGTIRVYGFQNS